MRVAPIPRGKANTASIPTCRATCTKRGQRCTARPMSGTRTTTPRRAASTAGPSSNVNAASDMNVGARAEHAGGGEPLSCDGQRDRRPRHRQHTRAMGADLARGDGVAGQGVESEVEPRRTRSAPVPGHLRRRHCSGGASHRASLWSRLPRLPGVEEAQAATGAGPSRPGPVRRRPAGGPAAQGRRGLEPTLPEVLNGAGNSSVGPPRAARWWGGTRDPGDRSREADRGAHGGFLGCRTLDGVRPHTRRARLAVVRGTGRASLGRHGHERHRRGRRVCRHGRIGHGGGDARHRQRNDRRSSSASCSDRSCGPPTPSP